MKSVEEIIGMVERKIEMLECSKTVQWNSYVKAETEDAKQLYYSYFIEASAQQVSFKKLLREIKEN